MVSRYSWLAGIVLFAASAYNLVLSRWIHAGGLFRTAQSLGNGDCVTVKSLQACEKLIVHSPSGLVYLACSTPKARLLWTPYFLLFKEAPTTDYIAIYDPSTSAVTHLELKGFRDSRGIFVHGMDVVASGTDPNKLYVYLVNHRPQSEGNEHKLGSDSVIEIFETTVGSHVLVHLRTVRDPNVIITPNDVTGSPDGKSFYFTNDHRSKADQFDRITQLVFNRPITSVGYCHSDEGCKFAATKLRSVNGIASSRDGSTLYVVDNQDGKVEVFQRENDNTLKATNSIWIGRSIDNLSVDPNGNIYAAAFVSAMRDFPQLLVNSSHICASSVYRISPSTSNLGAYHVSKIFEDDGHIASCSTSAAFDVERNRLYLHGIMAPHLASCAM